MSTTQNLQFLERQLNEYLHEHTVDDDNVLWVTDRGFRLPYAKTRENLERNMKYIERQLEEYLHEHAITQQDAEPGGELTLSSSTNMPVSARPFSTRAITVGGGFLWAIDSGSTSSEALVKLNLSTFAHEALLPVPNDGGSYVNRDIAYDSNNDTIWLNTHPDGDLIHQVSPSDGSILATVTAPSVDVWGLAHSGTHLWAGDVFNRNIYRIDPATGSSIVAFNEQTASVMIIHYDRARNLLWFDDGDLAYLISTDGTHQATHAYGGTLRQSDGFTLTDSGDTFYRAVRNTDVFPNQDIIQVWTAAAGTEGATDLFITDAGFRFPYNWQQTGALKHNMKFLETQISTYLHKHEEGVADAD